MKPDMHVTLHMALNGSDMDYLDGYHVETYHYPEGDGFDSHIILELADGDETRVQLDQKQPITLREDGRAMVRDTEGRDHLMAFRVIRPLTLMDLHQ